LSSFINLFADHRRGISSPETWQAASTFSPFLDVVRVMDFLAGGSDAVADLGPVERLAPRPSSPHRQNVSHGFVRLNRRYTPGIRAGGGCLAVPC
jgi:hypothetical protein